MVIQSSTFPPEVMYVMLMSVDTPVAQSPFDAAANDLWCQPDTVGMEGTRLNQSSWRLFRHVESRDDLSDASESAIVLLPSH